MRRLYFSPALLWSLVGLGAVLRLYWFLFDRALWFDEASVALDILYKSIPSLLRELHPVQPGPAPIGYLLASRAATVLFSDGERALRLVPLVCGLASLPLFLAVARQYCAAAVVPIALALFAISPSQIYFSAECKPYATDVMLALLMLWSASRAIESGLTWRRACELSVLGGVAIWCSFSIPFVLAGVGAALAIDVLVKPAASRAALFVVGGVWIASFATYYVVSLAALRGNPELASYWENFFLRPSDLTTSRRIFTTVFIYPLHLVDSRGWIAMPLFAVGCGALLARQRTRALALMLPILATVFASLLGLYPFFGRLILFAFPMFLLPTLEGVGQLAAWAKRIHPAAGIAVAAMVIVTGAMAEDALADAADGLFGGRTIEDRLEIMKDSRHGAYGVCAIVLLLGLRITAVGSVANPLAAAGVWIAASLMARSGALWLTIALPPARSGGAAATAGQVSRQSFGIGAVFMVVLSFVLAAFAVGVFGLIAAYALGALVVWGWITLCRRMIGGQTGDLIGALQALLEIAVLTVFMIFV